jgi:hypothetical protein
MMDLAVPLDAFAKRIDLDVTMPHEPEMTKGVLQAVGRTSRGALAQDFVHRDPQFSRTDSRESA